LRDAIAGAGPPAGAAGRGARRLDHDEFAGGLRGIALPRPGKDVTVIWAG
jgi:hypothetical protein